MGEIWGRNQNDKNDNFHYFSIKFLQNDKNDNCHYFSIKSYVVNDNFHYFSIKSYVVNVYKNRLAEAILIHIHNI